MAHDIVSLARGPELLPAVQRLHSDGWPRFMQANPLVARYWGPLIATFAEYQFVLRDDACHVIATGNAIPLAWDRSHGDWPAGWDAALEQGMLDHAAGRQPRVLCALAIVVAHPYLGHGYSSVMVRAMRELAALSGLSALIAPVRPTLKSRYPLTPMDRYVRWARGDGLPLDPWLRVHRRLGAELARVAPCSMTITGSVSEWEAWAEMRFPESGEYVVPGALQPVRIDCDRDLGRYEEPNVWMYHAIPHR